MSGGKATVRRSVPVLSSTMASKVFHGREPENRGTSGRMGVMVESQIPIQDMAEIISPTSSKLNSPRLVDPLRTKWGRVPICGKLSIWTIVRDLFPKKTSTRVMQLMPGTVETSEGVQRRRESTTHCIPDSKAVVWIADTIPLLSRHVYEYSGYPSHCSMAPR